VKGSRLDKAFCTSNKRTYDAEEFSQLPESEIAIRRQFLLCRTCGQKAFFRKAYNGMDALFGANPHLEECQERRTDPGKVREITKDLRTYLSNGLHVLKLNLSPWKSENANDKVALATDLKAKHQGDRPLSAGSTRPRNTWDLKDLLTALVLSPELAESDHVIEAPGAISPQPLAQFLAHSEHLNKKKHQGAVKGFWGTISNVNWGADNSLWINSGNVHMHGAQVDVRIMPKIADQFRELHPSGSLKDLVGCPILAIGTVPSYSVGFRVEVAELDHIAVLMHVVDH
jgi:hypothetical protein